MRFVTLVAKNLLRRKARTVLTGLGIAVAICSVVALLGIARGFERGFTEAFEGRGVDLIVVSGGSTDQLSSSMDQAVGARLRQLPGVRDVTCVLLELLAFEREGVMGAMVQGWPADGVMFRDLKIKAGHALRPDQPRTALLGSILAKNLKKTVGDTLDLDREEFTIVGIFESFNVFENGSAVVLLPELQRAMRRPGEVTAFSIMLDDSASKEAHTAALCRQIEEMKDDQGKRLRLNALPTRDYVTSTLQIRMAHAMAWTTGAIALIIGTVSMLNTMTTSVLERTREIGILRALGWGRARVVRMVLAEAVLLCVLGAVAGTLLAWCLLSGLTAIPSIGGFIQGDLSLAVIGQGFLIAAAVGVVGGAWPAWCAACLSPTEALRHD